MTVSQPLPARLQDRTARPSRPTWHLSCALLPLALFTGSAVLAQDTPTLDDAHLDVIPRTTAEAARIAAVTAPPTDFTAPSPFEHLSGGAATVRARQTADAFSQPSGNISFEDELTFKVGNGLFRKLWVSAPASTLASDGLGPLYNARSCQRCHIKDGRGHPPEAGDDNAISMFLRVSIPGGESDAIEEIEGYIASRPDPTYGTQLQDFAVLGLPAEYRLDVTYTENTIALADGTEVSLRHPTYRAADLGYGPLHPQAMLSPRVAPQMIGMGLLEAIPAADILALSDPQDADGDGISGRPNIVWSTALDKPMLGRFGHKAGNPSVLEQSASAFIGDIGISNPLFTAGAGECTDLQADCQAATHGDGDARGTEIDAEGLDLVTFYSRNLAVPERRNVDDPQVLRGKQVFHDTGCVTCHQPSFVTHRLNDQPAQSFQLIWPYSDMLLHDMGPGLADNRPEARATGTEWRTPPLWGIGLTQAVSGHTYFLHDGRARSLLEAILWHGGEAQGQRDAVIDLHAAERDALIAFLESL
ncbi:Cytochrome c [Sulfitobacter sp. THAF37]|uniref:di-heme oxidoreductase family protein n=1 Tax=Sulfitobacter sp. THAF37 TaxID=2587855 RepID=UPI001268785A|nr:di-heme oxidoredictase family protein [Sulfitobacter sp. THAF37]QFT57413.1 Cytochrome c [Sulfitobacter sp. THAF37]